MTFNYSLFSTSCCSTSAGGFVLQELSAVSDFKADKCRAVTTRFTGDITTVIEEYESKTEVITEHTYMLC